MQKSETIIFGGGCFWCTESIFKQLQGIISVTPGYAGGSLPNPTYDQVITGETGHAEVVKIIFDNSKISLNDLLSIFFSIHNPTTPNRQGNDVGSQYRSIILYTTKSQEDIINAKINELKASRVYSDPIVTTTEPLDKFYEAEDYHHDYFAKNPNRTYCQLVINPKLDKFKENWKRLIK